MHKSFARTAAVLTAGFCLLGTVNLPSVISSSNVYAADYFEDGDIDGYHYEVWRQNGTGELNYENTENNGYSVSWSNIENSFVMKGEAFERKEIFASQLKEYNVTYDADIDYMGQNNYCGIYGCMDEPDKYFYIIDSWGSWRPRGNDDKDYGSFESNGITYDIYRSVIAQIACFSDNNSPKYIYYSVARENQAEKIDGTCNIKNTVNVADHFKAWSEAGFELGYIYNIGFDSEGYRSSGSVKLNSLDITKEITPELNYGPVFAYKKHEPGEPDEEGRTVYTDFETDNDKFGTLSEECQASYSDERSVSGERSVLISAEGDNKRTFMYEIDPYDFRSSDLVSGIKLFQNSDKAVTFDFEVMFENNTRGIFFADKYSRTVPAGRWVSVEPFHFSVSADCFTKAYLTVTANEAVDFYADNLYICEADKYNEMINPSDDRVRGDINHDNSVDMFDIIALRKELIDASDFSIDAVHDVNGDCKLNISDLVLLTRFVLGQAKSIPEPEIGTELYLGSFNKEVNGTTHIVSAYGGNSKSVKTALRENGTFMAEWENVRNYEASSSRVLHGYDELSVKYSGKAVTDDQVFKNDSSYHDITVTLTAGFIKDGKTFNVFVVDGADEKDRLRWLSGADDMERVTIGGTEYYVDKETEGNDIFEPVYWLYPTENIIECGVPCSFEREIDFSEILKYYGMENAKPSEIKFELSADNTSGHIDIEELSFFDKTKTE
ncbi:glycoside hydrolase family 11 protein [Ruminococcus sp.]|uniref:glycoside hydrolase family 11 protein n=1 Tax=Ruminococcus sp. TaxID=41978 RepID=UPI0025FEAB87|nr:glycoside hydrolase family 11 protein [Ruminococcus sp.]